MSTVTDPVVTWSPNSWRLKPAAHQVAYADPAALDAAVSELSQLPPLVTSWEIEALKQQLAEAAQGQRFLLQGGDCAERFADCTPPHYEPSGLYPFTDESGAGAQQKP